jgi:tripartite-type tricarboxylate transporter receptor subunit TctC
MLGRWVILLVVIGFSACIDTAISAEGGYPTRPIEMVLGFAPGGGTDLGARMLCERAKALLGQEVTVTNKAGGGGRVALTLAAKAKADGYTLVASSDPAVVLIPHLEKVPYKPIDDFTYLVQYGMMDLGFAVSSASPFMKLKDLIDFARANPDTVTVSSTGPDSAGTVAFQAIALREGLTIKIVPFSGGAAAAAAALGGHVTVTANAMPVLSPHVKANKLRLLAVLGDERGITHPETPTLTELGYPIVLQNWYFVAAPRNLEKPVSQKLEDAFRKVIESPEYTKFAKDLLIWTRKPLWGESLKEAFVQRSKDQEELLKRLGIGLK